MKRIRTSQILLTVASILAFGYLAISQLASGWELPYGLFQFGHSFLVISTFVFLVSIVYFVISIKSFCKITLPFKIVYFVWIAIILVIYVLGYSMKAWAIGNLVLHQIFKYAFFPGLIVSLGLLIILQWGNRHAFKDD